MPADRAVYTTRQYVCPQCEAATKTLAWNYDAPPICVCGVEMIAFVDDVTTAPGVIPDDIPGGIDIRNAVCNPDGSPRRFYSKSAIRQAARDAGWTLYGETPKPPTGGYRDRSV